MMLDRIHLTCRSPASRPGPRIISRGTPGRDPTYRQLMHTFEISTSFEDVKAERVEFAAVGAHWILGLRSSCDRAELIFALVMRLTPVSTMAGTFSPLDAASAVLTPS
jgi:hypothetical protein